jgi:hypothetical protein
MNTPNPERCPGDAMPDVMLLHTGLCYLITLFTMRPCSGLACTIVHRLQLLLIHADLASRPDLRRMRVDLLQHWQKVADQQLAACSNGVSSPRGVTH